MIYLIGITHTYQARWKTATPPSLSKKFDRFEVFLCDAVKSTNVAAIAEETSQEFENSHGKSIARNIAEDIHPQLIYVPCEANTEERKALGIPTADEITAECLRRWQSGEIDNLEQCRDFELLKYFPPREKFWIERLRQVAASPILFLCGPNHIPTFFCRLIENGIPCKIFSANWDALDVKEFGELPLEEEPK
jgi:hypothetical protein